MGLVDEAELAVGRRSRRVEAGYVGLDVPAGWARPSRHGAIAIGVISGDQDAIAQGRAQSGEGHLVGPETLRRDADGAGRRIVAVARIGRVGGHGVLLVGPNPAYLGGGAGRDGAGPA